MKRPFSHVQEDISEDIFRSFLPAEWILRRKYKDYGIDLEVEIVNDEIVTGEVFWVQLKSRKGTILNNKKSYSDCGSNFLRYCRGCEVPVILILIDISAHEGYWVYMQDYIKTHRDLVEISHEKSKFRIPISYGQSLSEQRKIKYRDFNNIASSLKVRRCLLTFIDQVLAIKEAWKWADSFVFETIEDNDEPSELKDVMLKCREDIHNSVNAEMIKYLSINCGKQGESLKIYYDNIINSIDEFINLLDGGSRDPFKYGMFSGTISYEVKKIINVAEDLRKYYS